MVGMRIPPVRAFHILALSAGLATACLQRSDSPVLIYHAVQTDAGGRILPWYGGKPSEAYDHVIRLVYHFWATMKTCPNGLPYYLQHQVWTSEGEDPRGIGGDQVAMALSSWNLLHDYLGDPAILQNMTLMADHVLDHGMSAPGLPWANLPFPYNTVLHSGVYDGDMRAGPGYLQPDKAASFGAELVMLYKKTGNPRYLSAAVGIADTLATRIAPGDADHSPWPYRVNAATGEVHVDHSPSGMPVAATYTSNDTGALRLFSGLADLGAGNPAAYRRAQAMVEAWLKAYPLKTNKWGPFFEDIPTGLWSDTEINADTLAAYILEHPEWDPQGQAQARGILAWSASTLTDGRYFTLKVYPIDEQTVYRFPGNSHTARHASVELLYAEKTGDTSLKEGAIRQLNWATYMVDGDGRNQYPYDGIWLTDGYGDYVRHFLRAMASAPELAPDGQNHLLRTTSVVQSIQYGPDTITYSKFDAVSQETFKLGAWHPSAITGGSMAWDATRQVLAVEATAPTVVLSR